MAKNLIDRISVESPCSESWDEMTGNSNVRFCSHCSKDVHNLSEITRKQAEALIKRSNGKLCVRYRADQNGRVISQPPMLTKITRRATVAAGVLAASLAAGSVSYAQSSIYSPTKESNTEQTTSTKGANPNSNAVLTGTITDPFGAVLPGAIVTLTKHEDKHFKHTVISSSDGTYIFKSLKTGNYQLVFESPGFVTKVVKHIELKDGLKQTVTAVLELGTITVIVGIVAIENSNLTESSIGGVYTVRFK